MKGSFVLIFLIGTLLISCSTDDNPPNECDATSEVIAEDNFDAINTSNYVVLDVQLNGDCLEITIGSSGCDSNLWVLNLYSTNAFYAIYPIQRAVKIELINNQSCEAFFQKTISFDLTPFQIEKVNKVPLNIEGWNEQIVYEY